MGDQILRVSGEVATELSLTYDDLMKLPEEHQIEDVRKLDARRAGTAVWLEGILQAAKVTEEARFLGLHSSHDGFHKSITLAEVRKRGFVIYGLDGEPLPREKGGPVRFYVPDHASCNMDEIDACANVKFVDHIELMATKDFDNRPEDEDEHAKLHGH